MLNSPGEEDRIWKGCDTKLKKGWDGNVKEKKKPKQWWKNRWGEEKREEKTNFKLSQGGGMDKKNQIRGQSKTASRLGRK